MINDTAAILCPLCDYDLRGLPEPRCPECGASYSWEELTDPARKAHPYLFEHHPRRNLWSFCRTLIGGAMPRRFWASLHPGQTIVVRRLALYWMICCLPVLTTFAALFAHDLVVYRDADQAFRATMISRLVGTPQTYNPTIPAKSVSEIARRLAIRFRLFVNNGPYLIPDDEAQALLQKHGSLNRVLDDVAPTRSWIALASDFFRDCRITYNYGSILRQPIGTVAFAIALGIFAPVAMVSTMLIFRASMRQAGIRTAHLLRVAVYASDVLLWPALMLMAYVGVSIVTDLQMRISRPLAFGYSWGTNRFALQAVAIAALLAIVFATIRLAVAMRRYLQFKHAAAMAISVQIMLILAAMKLLLVMSGQ